MTRGQAIGKRLEGRRENVLVTLGVKAELWRRKGIAAVRWASR